MASIPLATLARAAEGGEVTSEETHKLNLRMSVEVMGWPIVDETNWRDSKYPAVCEFYNSKDGGDIFPLEDAKEFEHGTDNIWSPCTNIAQAFECVEKIREQANITVYGWGDRYVVTSFLRKWHGNSTEVHCQYRDLPRIICTVIAKTMDMAKPPKEQT